MSVEVAGVRKAVEISWETGNAPAPEPPPEEKPPGFPAHPIVLPPDGTWGGSGEPFPGTGLPEDQPKPEHPIYLPPYIDNSLPESPPGTWGGSGEPFPGTGLPGDQPKPDHELPGDQPYPDQGLPEPQPMPDHDLPTGDQDPDGNLPPAVMPHHGTVLAVQVFAQGQDGDWSNTAVMPNDGRAVLTYPEGFSGESYVEVRDLFGALVDSGTIQVEAN